MRIIHFIVLIVCFTACQNSTTTANLAENKTSPSPKPSLTKEELDKKVEEGKIERLKAIDDFIAKNYKGWQLKGISDESGECDENGSNPCDLLLINGQQEKVIAVMFKRFTLSDGQTQLVVFEARSIDLSKAKIKETKQSTLENLEYDDCENICDNHTNSE